MTRETIEFLLDLLAGQSIPVGDPNAREVARLVFQAQDELAGLLAEKGVIEDAR